MFKNFLTYQFALNFDQACHLLNLETQAQSELSRCSRGMLHHFHMSIRSRDRIEISKSLFVAITYLRDCREILDQAKIDDFEIRSKFEILHSRLEQLIVAASEAEDGQLRMLG